MGYGGRNRGRSAGIGAGAGVGMGALKAAGDVLNIPKGHEMQTKFSEKFKIKKKKKED